MKTAYRFMYQPTGYPSFVPVFELSGYRSEGTCQRLLAHWNRKDKGVRTWRFEPILEGDIDHPEVVARNHRKKGE